MKPLDQAIRDAFLEGIRRRGVAAGDVWDYVNAANIRSRPRGLGPAARGGKMNQA